MRNLSAINPPMLCCIISQRVHTISMFLLLSNCLINKLKKILVHPCLSFDIISDASKERQTEYPMSCTIVAGTQAEKVRDNQIIVMKLMNLTKQGTYLCDLLVMFQFH